jgi:hypothetical protein
MLRHVAASIHRLRDGDGFIIAVAQSFAQDTKEALDAAVASVNAGSN